MKYVAIIQARQGSSRLKGKALLDVCGEPVLKRVVQRVQKSCLVEEVIVATSIAPENLAIVNLCTELGVRVFVGSETDVLDRYYQAAKLLEPEYIVRITADCPCIDSVLLDDAIRSLEPASDYLGMMSETFADGLDIEIIRYAALCEAWEKASLASEREHVTQFIINRPNCFVLQDFSSNIEGFGSMRWTLDEKEDYQFICQIFDYFNDKGQEDFGVRDILLFLKEHPEVAQINSKYSRNEGLQVSIENDLHVLQQERRSK